MSRFILWAFVLFCGSSLFAQNTYTSAKDSDAKSVVALNKIKAKYSTAGQQITSVFTMKIDLPNQAARLEKGTMIQSGNKFNLSMKDMAIISDGKTVWFINKKQKEVQINDYSKDVSKGMVKPADFIIQYRPKTFISAVTIHGPKNGKKVMVMEIKSVDRKVDYSKVRVTVNKATNELIEMELFNKDGSRYTLNVSKTTFSKTTSSSSFGFDKSKYPGFNVEDLRVN